MPNSFINDKIVYLGLELEINPLPQIKEIEDLKVILYMENNVVNRIAINNDTSELEPQPNKER